MAYAMKRAHIGILIFYCLILLHEAAFSALNISVEAALVKIELITPAGDPVAAPVNAGDGQNEFTFSAAASGVLTMELKAKITPAGIADKIKDDVAFTVEAIGSSTMKWDAANPGGKPTVSGDFLTAKVLFDGLPDKNSAFGKKKLQVFLKGNMIAEQTYEVFFPKKETNNPGADHYPNWFYYWKDGAVCGIPATAIYETDNSWGYCRPGVDDIIRLCTLAPEANSGPETYFNDAGKSITVTGQGEGIQGVAETIAHEAHHLQQYNDTKGKIDTDADGVADLNEPTYDAIATEVNDPDTYNMGGGYSTYGDNEVRCRKIENNNIVGYFPKSDWANPGCQSKNHFGPTP